MKSLIHFAFILPILLFTTLASASRDDIGQACRRERSCFMALDGVQRGLCQAYMENSSCFMALDGVDRGWCQVLKEGKSCFMALDGVDREDCEDGYSPRSHLFWMRCARRY